LDIRYGEGKRARPSTNLKDTPKLITHISATNLMDWQNELLGKYKASSVKKYRTVFNSILEDARKELINGEKLITENPFRDVDVPKNPDIFEDWNDDIEQDDFKINPFTLDEIDSLLQKQPVSLKTSLGLCLVQE
jgi:hypothetical protein